MDLLYEWMAYARLNQVWFSPEYRQARADWNAGMMAAVFTNVMTGLWAKHGTKRQPRDFMYQERPSQPQTAAQIYQAFKMALTLGRHLTN